MRRMSAAVGVLVFGVVTAPTVAQQPPPTAATGVISGTLTAAASGDPVRKAPVQIVSAATRTVRAATTDQDGRFVFDAVPAGDYTLSGSKPGFLEMVYGARRPGLGEPGTVIKLSAGQTIKGLSFSLLRGGVISGTIVDEFGDPALNTTVRALRFMYIGGVRTVRTGPGATTDDRGQYRIPGLLPGEYLVTAVPRDTVAVAAYIADALRASQTELAASIRATDPARAAELDRMVKEMPAAPPPAGYVPVYYPGTPSPSNAASVRLGTSEEVFGIDMRLQVLRTATVTGVATTVEPASEIQVTLIDPTMPVESVGLWTRMVKDGKFTFSGVVPGTYILNAKAGVPPAAKFEMVAEKEIVVNVGAPSEHTLQLERGVSVMGTLAMDTLRGAADASRLRVELRPAPASVQWSFPVWREAPDAQGRFTFAGVAPGRFSIRVSGLPTGWSLASAVFAGQDAADHHLTVEAGGSYAGVLRFTDKTAEISGTLTNFMGAAAPDQTVIVFPDDRELWLRDSRRIQIIQPGPDGKYVARGLPPGDYRVATVLNPETGAWFDQEWLARIVPLAALVTLSESDRKILDVRVR